MKRSIVTRHPLEVLADELSEEWNATAEVLKDHVAVGAARAYRRCADAIERRVAEYLDEQLDVNEAAEESGYHPGHIGRLIDSHTLPSAQAGARLVRRRDLPRKPGYGTEPPMPAKRLRTRSEIARAIARGELD